MLQKTLTPNIWFQSDAGSAASVIDYYKDIFGEDLQTGTVVPLGQTPNGVAEMCQVTFFGQPYSFMCTEEEHHPLNDSVSLIIQCENQAEIDRFWDYFTNEGKESMCGWCIDKYGLRWQVIPKNLGELLRRPHADEVMMKQKKIIIAEYVEYIEPS